MFRNTLIRIPLVFLAVFASLLWISFACSSRRLDRARVAELIRQSRGFNQVYEMIIRHGSDKRYLDPISPDETKEQGEARAVENYRTSYPYRAVLMSLGLIDVKAKYISTTMYGNTEGRSTYDIDINLTGAGRKLWQDLGTEVDPAAVPLGKRKLVAITGIEGGDAAKESRASVKFSWQWELTPAGAAMSKGTDEYERLPDDVKSLFDSSESLPTFKVKSPLNLSGVHQGIAVLHLYDDGWRIDSIEPSQAKPLNPLD